MINEIWNNYYKQAVHNIKLKWTAEIKPMISLFLELKKNHNSEMSIFPCWQKIVPKSCLNLSNLFWTNGTLCGQKDKDISLHIYRYWQTLKLLHEALCVVKQGILTHSGGCYWKATKSPYPYKAMYQILIYSNLFWVTFRTDSKNVMDGQTHTTAIRSVGV